MFGRHGKQRTAEEQDLAVDAHLEQDLWAAEQSILSYLADPGESRRQDLLSALERLDDQIDLSDAYDSNIVGSGAIGLATKFSVIGETSSYPISEEVPSAEFQAQQVLIKAAKGAVSQPGSETLAALRTASAALTALRAADQPVQEPPG